VISASSITTAGSVKADSEREIDLELDHSTNAQNYREGMTLPPTLFVIFRANGDLTKRKLIPALYNLASSQHLPKQFSVVGVDCVPMSTEDFRNKILRDIPELSSRPIDPDIRAWLVQRLHYLSGDFRDSSHPGFRFSA
jgi:glucose-6-phosphate 1-dehydrogenase